MVVSLDQENVVLTHHYWQVENVNYRRSLKTNLVQKWDGAKWISISIPRIVFLTGDDRRK